MKRLCKISDYNWIHIGDGSRARTGALFTLHAKSMNVSIDPLIRGDILLRWIKKWDIENFNFIDNKFENVSEIYMDLVLETSKPYSITCVHAHVNLEEVDKQYPNWEYLYSSVCCYPSKQKFSEEYMKENNIKCLVNILDMNILSPEREIAIYKKNYGKNSINL